MATEAIHAKENVRILYLNNFGIPNEENVFYNGISSIKPKLALKF